MIKIGKKQLLKISDENDSGYRLSCEDGDFVFMPGALAKDKYSLGTTLEVFVYSDAKGNILCSPSVGHAQVGELAVLKVNAISDFGAFLDLGIPKDLFVPLEFQQFKMRKDEFHLVKIMLDDDGKRLVGTSKISSFLDNPKSLQIRQCVDLVPYRKTPLGFKVLIDKSYRGMIFDSEIFKPIELGQTYSGSIKFVRENGEIDALIGRSGFLEVKDSKDQILKKLENCGGKLDLGDKSSPIEIEKQLGMSKSTFKKSIGMLYKAKKITLEKNRIALLQN